ncbi:MAG: hypothetical protein KGL70_15985, partial [Betaproteobacteria bacterium]|nr:hypothetical protein [Betaproteobacteria bacterium]
HRELTRNAGNIALLSIAAEAGLLTTDLASAAADAYREYRRLQHQIRLTGAPHARVDAPPQSARRAAVDALWEHALGPRPDRLEFALRKRGDGRHVDG